MEKSFMHFLLQHQLKNKRTLNFLILMESIITAARVIQEKYQYSILHKTTGKTGTENIQGEEVMQLDKIAHEILLHYLIESQQVISAISEETEDIININPDGRYFVYFDPLDGSSNIKHNLPVGFMFGIAKKNLKGSEDNHIRSGRDFIAAGIFTIPNGIFNFALKDAGCWRFIVDPSGNYIRPELICLGGDSNNYELSFNSANTPYFSKKIETWITSNKRKYNFRYAGSLAIDFHRLLNNGGLFLYPAITRHENKDKNKPEGKLRLLYEAAVASFIMKEAGGESINDKGENILDIKVENPHQRTGFITGSKELIKELSTAL